jgi:hypothetical protein
LITQAKRTVERSWLGEVSSVVLQQSLWDVEAAYRAFFASMPAPYRLMPVRAGSRQTPARTAIRERNMFAGL